MGNVFSGPPSVKPNPAGERGINVSPNDSLDTTPTQHEALTNAVTADVVATPKIIRPRKEHTISPKQLRSGKQPLQEHTTAGSTPPNKRRGSLFGITHGITPPANRKSKQREITYVLGGSGVGKSTYIQMNMNFHIVIDPDKIRGLCPHEDPDPDGKGSITYKWTKTRCKELLEEAVVREVGQYAVPGTGKSTAREGLSSHMATILIRAKAAGFQTKLVYLKATPEIALKRNKMRPRALPDRLVLESLENAAKAFEILKMVVHEAIEVSASDDVSFMRGRSMTGGTPHEKPRQLEEKEPGAASRDSSFRSAAGSEFSDSYSIGAASDAPAEKLQALNAYHVIRKLGEGGFGKVRQLWRA